MDLATAWNGGYRQGDDMSLPSGEVSRPAEETTGRASLLPPALLWREHPYIFCLSTCSITHNIRAVHAAESYGAALGADACWSEAQGHYPRLPRSKCKGPSTGEDLKITTGFCDRSAHRPAGTIIGNGERAVRAVSYRHSPKINRSGRD